MARVLVKSIAVPAYNEATGTWTMGLAANPSNSVVIVNNGYITSSTSDAADNRSMTISGGGGGTAWTQNRGAGIVMQGNEAGGDITYYAGNISGGSHAFFTGGVEVGSASYAGAWTFGPSNGDNLTTTHIFKSGDASTGGAGARSVTLIRADCINTALSVSGVVLGNTANQMGMLYERGVSNNIWTRDNLNFIFSITDIPQSPLTGMTGYLNLGNITAAGAWTLGPDTFTGEHQIYGRTELATSDTTATTTSLGTSNAGFRIYNTNAGSAGRIAELSFGGRNNSSRPFATISSVLGSDSAGEQSGDLVFGMKSTTTAVATTEVGRISSTGDWKWGVTGVTHVMTGTNLHFADTDFSIGANTANSSDTKRIIVSGGGGGGGKTRGAYIALSGNEYGSSLGGQAYVTCGDAADSSGSNTAFSIQGSASTGAASADIAKVTGAGAWFFGNPSAAAKGITLQGNDAGYTASALKYYSEGTWTPTFTGGSGTPGSPTQTSSGFYTRIGRLVIASFDITITSKGTYDTGSAVRVSLPFTAGSTIVQAGCISNFSSFTSSLVFLSTNVGAGTAYVTFSKLTAASTNTATLLLSDLSASTSNINATITYLI